MTLEELKAAWEKAELEAKAKPADKDLAKAAAEAKAAYEDAKAKAEDDDDDKDPPAPSPDDEDEEIDESKLDERTKKHLAKLRSENAKARIKNKELNSKLTMSESQKKKMLEAAGLLDEEKPEEKLQTAMQQNQELAFSKAVLESAIAHGIPTEQLEFYEFLIRKKTDTLEEGEELSEEDLGEIVKKCKGGKKPANSTVKKLDKDGKPIEDPSPGGGDDKVTYEKFLKMSVMARSALYLKDPQLYETFYNRAKAEKKPIV